jgi:hypothetical protein
MASASLNGATSSQDCGPPEIAELPGAGMHLPFPAWVDFTCARKCRVENGLTPTEVMTGFCRSPPATQRGPWPQPGLDHDCDYLSITASTGTPIWVAMGV